MPFNVVNVVKNWNFINTAALKARPRAVPKILVHYDVE